MGRPCSAQRLALLEALDRGPGTSRDLASRSGLSPDVAMEALNNMVRKGVPCAVVLRHERVPGCKRPVPVYGRLHNNGHAANDDGVGITFAQLGLALFGQVSMGGAAA